MTRTSEKAFYDDIWLAWREMQRCAPAPRYLRRMVMKELGRRMRRMCKRHIVVSVPGGELDDCGRRNGHDRHYTKADLVQKMERTGFRVTRAFTCGWPVHSLFYRQLLRHLPQDAVDSVGLGATTGASA